MRTATAKLAVALGTLAGAGATASSAWAGTDVYTTNHTWEYLPGMYEYPEGPPESPFYSNEGKNNGNGLCTGEWAHASFWYLYNNQCISGTGTLYDAYPHSGSLYLMPDVENETNAESVWGWEWW